MVDLENFERVNAPRDSKVYRKIVVYQFSDMRFGANKADSSQKYLFQIFQLTVDSCFIMTTCVLKHAGIQNRSPFALYECFLICFVLILICFVVVVICYI